MWTDAERLRQLARYAREWDMPSGAEGALLAGAAALEREAQREGECERLREALTALVAYEPVLSVGDAYDYCAYCTGRSPQHLDWCPWTAARAALSPAGTAKEEDRG